MRMRKLFGFLLLIGALSACLQKQPVEDVPDKLKKTMKQFLEQSAQGNTTGTQFTVEEGAYYDGPDFYECEFKVRMKRLQGSDTTGQMQARIKKDYSSVIRKY